MTWRCLPVGVDRADINFSAEVVLQTNDKKEYAIPRPAIGLSKLLSELLQDADDTQTTVPLANVDAITFEAVADFLVHFIDPSKPTLLERPLKGPLPELINEWEKEFVYKKLFKDGREKEHELLFKTLLAANFLGIDSLRDLCCAAIANMLRGKTPEQIMELFGVSEPFTEDEERAIEQQYPWLIEPAEDQTCS